MAQSVIGALRVNLGIDSAQFSEGLKKAEASSNKFARSLKVGFAAAATAAAAALGVLSIAVKSTIASANSLGDVSDRLGVNVERLQELRYAAERGGMSINNFDVALRRFVRRSAEAAKGTGAAKNAFKELGIELKDANGQLKPSETLLHEVADAMRGIQSPADKLRLAFQMFDTDGAAMVNVLANGSQGMKDLAGEAQRLGLVLSEDTVRSAKAITDNFDMAGNVIGGMINRLTAFLAPAMVVVSEAAVKLALKFHSVIDVLPTIAEYAAVAGGALALMVAPALIAAVQSLIVAIGVGLVGAVRALTVAIAANPLGALAIAIMAAVTAAYHFRDEIHKAIGVDVVAIAKDAANLLINSFRAAFEDIKFVWNNFGNIMGAAVIGGVNVAIRALNGLVQKAAEGLDWLIGKINKIPGVTIDPIGGMNVLSEIENPYAGVLSNALGDHNAKIQEIMSSDPIGAIARAFTASTPAVANFNNVLATTNNELEDMGGGGKGGGKSKLKAAKDGIKDAAKEMEHFADRVAGTMTNIFQGLVDGSKSVKETIADLLKQLSSMLMHEGFKALVGGFFGGGGGGGFFSGIGKLFGFARGGTILPGGAGGIDSQLVAFRKSPNERVDITKPGQSLTTGPQEIIVSGVFIDDNGVIKGEITSMGAQAAQAGARIAVNQVNQGLPNMIANAQARDM